MEKQGAWSVEPTFYMLPFRICFLGGIPGANHGLHLIHHMTIMSGQLRKEHVIGTWRYVKHESDRPAIISVLGYSPSMMAEHPNNILHTNIFSGPDAGTGLPHEVGLARVSTFVDHWSLCTLMQWQTCCILFEVLHAQIECHCLGTSSHIFTRTHLYSYNTSCYVSRSCTSVHFAQTSDHVLANTSGSFRTWDV